MHFKLWKKSSKNPNQERQMNKKLIIPRHIVTSDSEGNIFEEHIIELWGNEIHAIKKYNEFFINNFDGEVLNINHLTVIPGFVQTHIHLCQTLFRGLADDLELLDWLQLKIFPFENAHDKNSLRVSSKLGINELIAGGTTTILDMGTLNHQEVIFEELISSGMRAIAGKCMMDVNDLFPEFKGSTQSEVEESYKMAKEFHNYYSGKIKYGFAPRFVLSCSEKLLRETGEMVKDFNGSIFHTHSSENKDEISEVRKRFNKENIDYFNSLNVLSDHSVLAHCIHVSDNEIKILENKNVRVAHCPSSNLKLGSGIANIPYYLEKGISVSLGADGAPCNNNLSIFEEMRLASLIQKPIHGATAMDAETIFSMATIEGAKALHLENEIGSIEPGKKADLVFMDLDDTELPMLNSKDQIYSSIVYSASKKNIHSVMVDGEFVFNNGKSLMYDQNELLSTGKSELNKLLKRADK
jgi:5-methylthioadenosine/S-adenosylhomocysteine deaminase